MGFSLFSFIMIIRTYLENSLAKIYAIFFSFCTQFWQNCCQNTWLSKKIRGRCEKFEFWADGTEVLIFLVTQFRQKFQMKLAIFLQHCFIHHKSFTKHYGGTATAVAAPIFPEKTWALIRQEPFAKIIFLKLIWIGFEWAFALQKAFHWE